MEAGPDVCGQGIATGGVEERISSIRYGLIDKIPDLSLGREQKKIEVTIYSCGLACAGNEE